MQCVDGLLFQRYVRKGNDAKNPSILRFFFVIERISRNLAEKNSSETTWMIYHKMFEFDRGNFNNTGNVSKTSYSELQNPLSQNFIRTVWTEGILYEFVVGK